MRLKDRTLKNVYERRELRSTAQPLFEAMDMQKLNAASAAMTKLKALVPDGANMFKKAVEAAEKDLAAYTRGGMWQAAKNAVGGDPVLKATLMGNALHAGFAAMPKILTMFLPKEMQQEGQRSVLELIPSEKQKSFIQSMTKAFAPTATGTVTGDIKSFFSDNVMPYVNNLAAAVQEMMHITAPNGAFKLGQQAAATPDVVPTDAPKPVDQAADPNAPATAGQASPTPAAGAAASGAPTAGTTATAPTQAAAAAKQAVAPTPPKVAQTSSNKRLDAAADAQKINDIAFFLSKQAGVDEATTAKILKSLVGLKGLMDIEVPKKPAAPSNKLAGGNVPPAPAGSTPSAAAGSPAPFKG